MRKPSQDIAIHLMYTAFEDVKFDLSKSEAVGDLVEALATHLGLTLHAHSFMSDHCHILISGNQENQILAFTHLAITELQVLLQSYDDQPLLDSTVHIQMLPKHSDLTILLDYALRYPNVLHFSFIKALLDAGADPNAILPDGEILLRRVILQRFPRVDLLIQYGADPSTVCRGGYTALQASARIGPPSLNTLLLDAGADRTINQQQPASGYRSTALHEAAWSKKTNRCDVIRVLLNAGASKNIINDFGNTPWDNADDHIRAKCPELEP